MGYTHEHKNRAVPEVMPGGREDLARRCRVINAGDGARDLRRRESRHVRRGSETAPRVQVALVGQVVGDRAPPDQALQQGSGGEAVSAVQSGARYFSCGGGMSRHVRAATEEVDRRYGEEASGGEGRSATRLSLWEGL